MSDMKELAGVWKTTGRSGATYYSGKVKEDITIPAGSYINVFQNKDATDENRKPQLRILFNEPEGQRQQAPQRSYENRREQAPADDLSDEIPW
jgi:hypothetical protein